MDALRASKYRAIGVYVGGAARACAQPNLTAGWVSQQIVNGWHPVPLYVGLQAPCTNFSSRIDPAQAATQGAAAAEDAANLSYDLGMGQGSVITFDMEGGYARTAACSAAILQFLSAWTTQLHNRGYRSGVYSSVTGAIADLAGSYNDATYTRPDQIFFARWDGSVTTADTTLAPEFWSDHQRMKQYGGPHDEPVGAVPNTINVDSDYLDVAANTTIPSDTTPPAISFAQPAAGARLRGTISVTANASDSSGISRVELLVNGQVVNTARTAPWTVSWASGSANTAVMLGLRTYDRRGNVATAQRAVIVDNLKPTLKITAAPKNNARVGGTVTVLATAADTFGVARLELWINGKRVATDAKRPYKFSIKTAKYGKKLKVQIRAYDRAGNVKATTRNWRR
jgi:hypothetical protein